jgi:serine/threonine-protein kinase HipA
MSVAVHVFTDLGAGQLPVGTAYVDPRSLATAFAYSSDYLSARGAYQVDPAFPLAAGQHYSGGLPGCFRDASPDRWGRNLLRKAWTGKRAISELDFLLGVSDETRIGALRFATAPDGPVLAEGTRVPKLVQLPRLMAAADEAATADGLGGVKELLSAGTGSLGGARPKAVVEDDGHQWLAKFAHGSDAWSVPAWEKTVSDLAARAGVAVPPTRLHRVGGAHVLLSRRFDRNSLRVGYLSAMTLLRAQDGDRRDYLEFADELAAWSAAPAADLAQLWLRIAFNIAVGNTDDHLRNHALLHDGKGWRLAPAFDVNPDPTGRRRQTAIDGADTPVESIAALRASAPEFGLSPTEAERLLAQVRQAVSGWIQAALVNGIPAAELEILAPAFRKGADTLS